MTTSTFATVAVLAADQAAAQSDFPGMFTTGFTDNREQQETPTHYVSSGAFYDTELDKIVNDVTWPRVVRFGDAQAALESLGLVPVLIPVDSDALGQA